MALKSHSFPLRVFFVVSLLFNVVFISRSLTGRKAVQHHAHRFHHRAVALEKEPAAASESRDQTPIHHDYQEVASSLEAQDDAPPRFPVTKSRKSPSLPNVNIRTAQHSQVAVIKHDDNSWAVIEDFSKTDGDIIFECARTKERRVFPKTEEATFQEYDDEHPIFAGLQLANIGMAAQDLLADRLLEGGEPEERRVRFTIPPIGSAEPPKTGSNPPEWTSFLGTAEASDTAPVFRSGFTKTYHPIQDFPEIKAYNQKIFEGKVGGWMPATRKVLTKNEADEDSSPTDYIEIISFGDVDARDPFIVQTWHRTAHITNRTLERVVYAHSYPSFPPSKPQESPERFYRALFRFGDYWNVKLSDMAHIVLPDPSWENMAKYAFATELMVRPGGNYPKYGAVDRDYAGSEYDGFQDIFTSSLSANLEWGRFAQAWNVIDNYLTLFVSTNDGAINMRGPEVGQFGLTLSLLAKYWRYSGEVDLLLKHRDKIAGLAKVLTGLHDESLKLNPSQPGYGLLHGWSESDAALNAKPDAFWQPYYSNTALTIRGLRDISALPIFSEHATDWTKRAEALTTRLTESILTSIINGPGTSKNATALTYVPALPGTNLTFRQSMATENPSPQSWPHRLYTELLHSAVLPPNISNLVIDTMRNFGATSMGVVANVDKPIPTGRDILGFISYGYAYSLLLNDRIDEFVLFLYTHRYHVHTRGAWKAGEVTEINGGNSLFCIPAQLTIPSILRWALVLEHPDEDTLFLGRGIPRAWLATGKEVSILQAPTRWGKVDFGIQVAGQGVSLGSGVKVRARVVFGNRFPGTVEFKLRMPKGIVLTRVMVNGREMTVNGEENVVVLLDGRESPIIVEGF